MLSVSKLERQRTSGTQKRSKSDFMYCRKVPFRPARNLKKEFRGYRNKVTKKSLAFCFWHFFALSDKTNSDWVFIPMVTGNQINGYNKKVPFIKGSMFTLQFCRHFLFGGS